MIIGVALPHRSHSALGLQRHRVERFSPFGGMHQIVLMVWLWIGGYMDGRRRGTGSTTLRLPGQQWFLDRLKVNFVITRKQPVFI